MSETIQKDGKDIEVFTQEELDESINKATKEAVDKYKEENPDISSDLTEAKEKVEKLTKEIDKAKEDASDNNENDTEQVKRLKKEKRDAEDKYEKVMDGVVKDIDQLKSSTSDLGTKSILEKYSNGDKELEEKIQIEFKNYRPNDTSNEAIVERMAKAYQLAGGNPTAPHILDAATGGGGKGGGKNNANPDDKYSDNQKKIAKELGISQEDMEKYGSKKV